MSPPWTDRIDAAEGSECERSGWLSNVSDAAVVDSVATGSWRASLQKLLSKLDVPHMSPSSQSYDPFHRTESEKKLSGERIPSIADSGHDSPINRWPPRASVAVALEEIRRHTESDLKPCSLKFDTAWFDDSLPDVTEADAVADDEIILPSWCIFSFPWSSCPVSGQPSLAPLAQRTPLNTDWAAHEATSSLINNVGIECWCEDWRIKGDLVLNGSFEERAADVCDALRRALLAVVVPVAGPDVVLSVWRHRDHSASHAGTVLMHASPGKLLTGYNAFLTFNFELVCPCPFEFVLARNVLRSETATAECVAALSSPDLFREHMACGTRYTSRYGANPFKTNRCERRDAASRVSVRLEMEPARCVVAATPLMDDRSYLPVHQ